MVVKLFVREVMSPLEKVQSVESSQELCQFLGAFPAFEAIHILSRSDYMKIHAKFVEEKLPQIVFRILKSFAEYPPTNVIVNAVVPEKTPKSPNSSTTFYTEQDQDIKAKIVTILKNFTKVHVSAEQLQFNQFIEILRTPTTKLLSEFDDKEQSLSWKQSIGEIALSLINSKYFSDVKTLEIFRSKAHMTLLVSSLFECIKRYDLENCTILLQLAVSILKQTARQSNVLVEDFAKAGGYDAIVLLLLSCATPQNTNPNIHVSSFSYLKYHAEKKC